MKEADDPWASYERVGRETRDAVLRLLPDDWSFEDKRVLDFGCGAGRTLRHFLDVAEAAELHGCDIDAESIEWLSAALSPPLHVSANERQPGLPHPDGSFDLIWCASVFTHIADGWAAWAIELHRLLSEDGLLIVSFISPQWAGNLPFKRDGIVINSNHVGMNAFGVGRPQGAPVIVHSEWWLRAHWGRAFEILELAETGFRRPRDQGYMLLRKRRDRISVESLEAPEPGEPREAIAARENVRQLSAELEHAWGEWKKLRAELRAARAGG